MPSDPLHPSIFRPPTALANLLQGNLGNTGWWRGLLKKERIPIEEGIRDRFDARSENVLCEADGVNVSRHGITTSLDHAELWLTTQKDAVKILPAWSGDLDLKVLVIELQTADRVGEPMLLDWLVDRLVAASD